MTKGKLLVAALGAVSLALALVNHLALWDTPRTAIFVAVSLGCAALLAKEGRRVTASALAILSLAQIGIVVAGETRMRDGVRHDLVVEGRTRTYTVVPPPEAGSEPRPVVIALHGFRQTTKAFRRITGIDRAAADTGAILVLPEGYEKSWNDGDDSKPATKDDVDDLAFLRALIDDVQRDDSVDPDRISAVGFSNGGFLLVRHACALADRLAGIAVVAAGAYREADLRCNGRGSLPILFVLGTDDPMVPWDGWKNYRGALPKDSGEIFARTNACNPEPIETEMPDIDDGTRTTRLDYRPCRDEATVTFYQVDNGGHTWPGGKQYLPRLLIGRTSRDWNASSEIVEFLLSHENRPRSPSLAMALAESGATTSEEIVRFVGDWIDTPDNRWVGFERDLNAHGYDLLGAGELDRALEVFRANTILVPESWNVWDSYGEALQKADRRDEAITAYQRSIQLNPENENGERQLRQLRGGTSE